MSYKQSLVFVIIAGAMLGLALPVIRASAPAPEQAEAVADLPRLSALQSADDPGHWADEVTLHREADGHFYAEVSVDGVPTRMLVDTGASVIALTGEDAAAIGLVWNDADIAPVAQGAGGPVMGVRIVLPRVALGGFEVENLAAVIVPEGLSVSLLGQAFLSQVGTVEISGEDMLLGTVE